MASGASAHDSLAPPGAHHAWLPQETWVFAHWMPFDQARLERALRLRGRELEAYLFNDHHTLAVLARRRGVEVDALADHLVAPWRPHVDSARLALLRERTMRVLTQGHLAQHMFFHAFHSFGMGAAAAERLFGVSPARLQRLRVQGVTPLAVARRNGVSRRRLVDGLTGVLQERHRVAIAGGQAWPAQSGRFLARQMETLACWVRSPRPSGDTGNPYGKATLQHGVHPPGWPFTAAQRRRDERLTERVRRSLRRSCWPRVPAWRPARPHAATAFEPPPGARAGGAGLYGLNPA